MKLLVRPIKAMNLLSKHTSNITNSYPNTDAAVYYQLSRWLSEKNININDIISNKNEIQRLGQEFLKEVYPGMEKPPNEMIRLMTSDDVDKTMNSVAILNPPEDPCDSDR